MSDLFGNHIVGFPTRRLICCIRTGARGDYLYSYSFNPFLTNGHAHHYQLAESTFILRATRSDFIFLFHFSMKFDEIPL